MIFRLLFYGLIAVNSSTPCENNMTSESFFLFSFESEKRSSLHRKEVYYWLCKESEILNEKEPVLYPIIFDNFSDFSLKTCCTSDTSFVYARVEGATKVLNDAIVYRINEILELHNKHKFQLQEIRKKWATKDLTKLKVYVTPLQGYFCECFVSSKERLLRKDLKKVYMVGSSVSLNKSNSNSQILMEKLPFDFSFISYEY